MSTKNSVLILAQRIAKEIVAEQTRARLSLGLDAAIIAAHEALGMGPGRAESFRQAYVTAMDELAGMFVDDAGKKPSEGDREIVYAKAKRDEIIRKIVGEANFVPFDLSYGAAYMDELKRLRVMKGEADGKT